MDSLPVAAEFPDQLECAERVCQVVATDLADKQLPFLDALQHFATVARQHGLGLPIKWACLVAWDDRLRDVITWYADNLRQQDDSKALLFVVRDIVASEQFLSAPMLHVAQLSIMLSTLEARHGHYDYALRAAEWFLDETAGLEMDEGIRRIRAALLDRSNKYRKLISEADTSSEAPAAQEEGMELESADVEAAPEATTPPASRALVTPRPLEKAYHDPETEITPFGSEMEWAETTEAATTSTPGKAAPYVPLTPASGPSADAQAEMRRRRWGEIAEAPDSPESPIKKARGPSSPGASLRTDEEHEAAVRDSE